MTIHPMRLGVLILLAGFALSFYRFFLPYSGDLMATWLAGHFLNVGRPDQVYPLLTDFFIMHPPSEWRAYMAEAYGYEGPMFPFLYPPLWAKVAELASDVNFWMIAAVALALNAGLLMASTWLAYRASRSGLHPALYFGIVLLILHVTHIGTLALYENQPQILVSFLLILAVERSRAKAPITAGLALAIAASIKLYPALFALFWLFGRNNRAFLAFAAFGTALGLASVIWAGWPLHAAFLDQIRLISRTVLLTGVSFNIDATIAQLFFLDMLQWVPSLEPPNEYNDAPGWYAMAKPPAWRILSGAILLSVVALLCLAFHRANAAVQASILWPLALTAVALLSPLSWVYYYLPAAYFAPVLLEKLGPKLGAAIIAIGFGLLSAPIVPLYWAIEDRIGWPHHLYQIVGVVALTFLAFGFLLALWKAPGRAETGPNAEAGLAPD